jgi:hypothetical protein
MISDQLTRFGDWIETPVIRIVAPGVNLMAGLCAIIVSYEFSEEARRYPSFAGVWEILDGPIPFFTVLFCISASFLLSLFLAKRAPTHDRLVSERDKARDASAKVGENIVFVMEGLLYNLGRKLGFSAEGHSRVSLYVYDDAQDVFVPCGRFSHNPVYAKKGRTKFNASQGCIGKAWRNDWHFDNSIPDDWSAATSYHKENYNIPKGTAAALKMRSRLIAGKKVVDQNNRPTAIIVVESAKADAFGEEELRVKVESVADDFGRIVAGLRSYIPIPSDAEEAGL